MEIRNVIVLALLLGACGTGEQSRGGTAVEPAPASAEAPRAEPVRLSHDRIYFDLTRYSWYAQGEPLLHAEQAYQPAGMPLAAPLTEMAKAGEYQGVEYYRRNGDQASLYVPVFDGYWLAFRTVHATARAD